MALDKKYSIDEVVKLRDSLCAILEQNKAYNVNIIDLEGKSAISDFMVIASAQNSVHLRALSQYLLRHLKKLGIKNVKLEGEQGLNWLIVDIGDIIVHLFREEVREYYALEELWKVVQKER